MHKPNDPSTKRAQFTGAAALKHDPGAARLWKTHLADQRFEFSVALWKSSKTILSSFRHLSA
jgi:hypothetical protein